jgi:hypothetical protein
MWFWFLFFVTAAPLPGIAVIIRDYNKVDYSEFSSLSDLQSAYFPHDIASINV